MTDHPYTQLVMLSRADNLSFCLAFCYGTSVFFLANKIVPTFYFSKISLWCDSPSYAKMPTFLLAMSYNVILALIFFFGESTKNVWLDGLSN